MFAESPSGALCEGVSVLCRGSFCESEEGFQGFGFSCLMLFRVFEGLKRAYLIGEDSDL